MASSSIASIDDDQPYVKQNFLSASQIASLRNDAKLLYEAGAFRGGGVGGRKESSLEQRTRACDICGLFDDAEEGRGEGIGEIEARDEIVSSMEELVTTLNEKLTRELLMDSMELQYLRYPGDGAGFYSRHLDHNSPGDDELDVQRSISLLIYLNEDDWDAERDGGLLRCFVNGGDGDSETDTAVVVEPRGGSLVLFDSKKLEHEVTSTARVRWALVGWFLEKKRRKKRKKKRKRGT